MLPAKDPHLIMKAKHVERIYHVNENEPTNAGSNTYQTKQTLKQRL